MTLSLTISLLILIPLVSISIVNADDPDEFYPGERDALLQLRDFLNSSSNWDADWAGPPCYKNQSQWSGVSCYNWHVVELVLEGFALSGSLPPTFPRNLTFLTKISFNNNLIYGHLPNLVNLANLEILLFSQNRFLGSIPRNYARLPKLRLLELEENYLSGSIPHFDQPTLTVFNVSYNHLEGPIPNTSVLQRFPKSSYAHNLNLCGSPLEISCPVAPPPSVPPAPHSDNKKTLKVWSIALITVAAALVPILVILVFLCYYKRVLGKETKTERHLVAGEASEKAVYCSGSKKDPERTIELEFFSNDVSVFDLDDLLRASAELLGKGQLGATYKAILESGSAVVVKRLKDMNGLGKKEFTQQMQLLGKLRHQNLVEIVSFYYATEEKLVINEFVPDGNLFDLLHENRGAGRVALTWGARLSIIKDIAKGMTFLHQSLPSHKVPHANLKSSNVVISCSRGDDHSYHSKLTDFGFLPLLPSRINPSEKLAVGRSPESLEWKKLTHKSDVYCFGIVLLEVITGRNPGETNQDLSGWVRMVVENDWSTDILDVEIAATREGHDDMLSLTELALECTHANPEMRPKMSQVLTRVQEIELLGQIQ